MCRRIITLWALLILAPPLSLLATEVTEARWNGRDFVITFSDSIRYQIDLAETDSSVVVIRFPATTIAAHAKLNQLRNHQSATAGFSPTPDGGLRLTLTSRSRFGYSTLWRPFSKRLIIHTFDWKGLPYNQEQYHKGLLALESGLNQQAEELLGVAYATGEQRAASVLGVMYALAGRDSLARRYLATPADEDDRQALQQLGSNNNGTTKPNRTDSNATSTIHPIPVEPTFQDSPTGPPTSTSRSFMDTFNDWRVLVAVIGGLLLFIIALAILIRSSRKKPSPSTTTSTPTEEPDIRLVRQPEPAATTAFATPPIPPTSPVAPPLPEPNPEVAVTEFAAPANAAPIIEAVTVAATAVQTDLIIPAIAAPVVPVENIEVQSASTDSVATAITEIFTEPVVLPVAAIVTEQKLKQPVGGLIESNSATIVVAKATNIPADPPPSSSQSRRMSGQAMQLQQRIEAARRGEIIVSSTEVPAVYEARRLNVSRDNVELRRRISDLKRKES